LLQQLSESFLVKDLGPLHYFLGIEVAFNSWGMVLTQRKYAQDIIRPVHIENCKHVSTPLCYTEKLSKHNDVPLCEKDSFAYQSTVGVLQYLTLTRPDLFFAVKKACRFLAKPTYVHWEAVKRTLRFIKGMIATGLRFTRSSSTLLSIFTDAD
jgi:hypothetical protein